MSTYSPRVVTIRLVVDEPDVGERHRVTFAMPLYEPQIDGADLAETMDASAARADEQGFALLLVHGWQLNQLQGWQAAWQALKLSPCDGIAAVRALVAVGAWLDSQPRARGQHGRMLDGIDWRDFLLADVLRRMDEGLGVRAAVRATLETHDPDGLMEFNTLLQMLKRYRADS